MRELFSVEALGRMGIKVLTKLISSKVPGAIRVGSVPNYYGRRIAVDASMFLYSFLTAIRKEENCLLGPNGEETRFEILYQNILNSSFLIIII